MLYFFFRDLNNVFKYFQGCNCQISNKKKQKLGGHGEKYKLSGF